MARAQPGSGRSGRRASTGAVVTAPASFIGPPVPSGLPLINPGPDPVIPGGSDPPQHRCHLPDDGGVGAVNGIVVGVVRQQPHLSVLALERLDRGLAVDQCCDDLAVLCRLLLADDDVVAVAD